MIVRILQSQTMPRAAAAAALLVLGAGLAGCASMGDSMSTAFADPAKYQLYDCKQLEKERVSLDTRSAELQGLIEKAQTGVAGPVVAEIAYRNEAIAIQGQRKFAEEAWRQNKCRPSPPGPPAATPAATAASIANATGAKPAKGAPPPPPRSGSAVY